MTNHGLELGDRVSDLITGFEGTITGHCVYITGCDQFLVNPGDPEGKIQSQWIDVDRLKFLTGPTLAVEEVLKRVKKTTTPGCDVPAPIR